MTDANDEEIIKGQIEENPKQSDSEIDILENDKELDTDRGKILHR